MKKFFGRFAVLLVLFIAAFAVFYNSISEHTYTDTVTKVENISASLPVVSFEVNKNEINLTKGHTVMIDDSYPRESITPVSTVKQFSILIDEKGESVKKASFTVFDIPGLNPVYDVDSIAYERDSDGRLRINVAIDVDLAKDTEYLAKLTILNGDGDRVYYYTRLLIANFSSLSGSLEYAENFHDSALDKERVYDLEQVMETDEELSNVNLAYVNIKSDLTSLGYGGMTPVEIYRNVPTITEYNREYASIVINFWISWDNEGETSIYKCKERYRFQYSERKTYVYDYERFMDQIFDPSFYREGSNKVKLGITNEQDVEMIYSKDQSSVVFNYQGALWKMDLRNNEIIELLSYRDANDYDRAIDKNYDFEVLSVDNTGDVSFAVYGYIGKGVYEGRTGVVYYHYYAANNRIEEMLFIPVNVDYIDLAGEFGKVSYTNEYNVFFFTLFDAYYSYELETNVLKTEVEDLGDDWLYFDNEKMLVYDENPDCTANKRIVLRNVANQNIDYIEAPEGKVIDLLGTVDDRLVYGVANAKNVSFFEDGSVMLPYDGIYIADLDKKIVNKYERPANKYICSVEIKPGVIELGLYSVASQANGASKAVFNFIDNDVIVNLNSVEEPPKHYTSTYNQTTLTEYYLSLPASYKPESAPKRLSAGSTVISKDTSALIKYEKSKNYYVYSYGNIVLSTPDLGEAILGAFEKTGAIMRYDGTVFWIRGLRETSHEVPKMPLEVEQTQFKTQQACLQLILDQMGIKENAYTYDPAETPILDWMREYISAYADIVRGPNIREVLYFVSDDHPVIACYKNYYIVIYRYTPEFGYFVDPTIGESVALEREELQKEIERAGGYYYVY